MMLQNTLIDSMFKKCAIQCNTINVSFVGGKPHGIVKLNVLNLNKQVKLCKCAEKYAFIFGRTGMNE